VAGGERRHESVAAGVDALEHLAEDDPVVLVHDGARPLVRAALIDSVASAAAEAGAAIPVVPVVETVKRVVDGQVRATVDRSELALAQTPQGARLSLLRRAFEHYPPSASQAWTDEAALLEASGIPVRAVAGEPTNFKVTLAADLERASWLLTGGTSPRVGLGTDSHPFGPGRPLALGGIELADAPRLSGHSDGDVALHAIADALLGAAGMGDLGRLFPSGPATPAGIASSVLLADVVGRVRQAGLDIRSIDLTIVAGRPRLAGSLDAMRQAIWAIIGGSPAAIVNVKASTGNLAGMEGAGRGISAQAVVTVVPAGTLLPRNETERQLR
jgi:2-C-methyl-D-erythritol 4-phosphate cytidylyltransferase/2-C-methyl-D-erythritol 2,4-cyclodiphosphate synthase